MKYIRCIGIKFTFLLFLLSGFRLFGQIVHVDPAATGTGDGASWANAVTDLQAGIDLAATVASSSFPIQVWIKSGTYKATTGTDREVSYELKSYVELYGGFDGTETTLAQRTISANPTVLSGDIGTINDAADNSRTTFIYTSSFEGPIIIDGLTLDSYTNISNANGAVGLIFGPEGPIPVVEYLNCVFQNNEITFGSVTGFSEIPHVFQSCTFLNNGVGGAVRNAIRVANIDADITVENSLFVGNREPILRQLGKLRLVNNTFVKNTVNVLYLQEQTTSFNAFVYNNIFWGNPGTDMVVDANAVQDLIADRNIVEDPFTFGTSTISEEPLFQDFTGGDYSLTVCSPALEVGNNSVISGSITEDLAGNPRLSNNTIDLGAFENPNMPLLFSAIEVGPIQCAGESTGSISVNAGGGTGSGVRYSLDGSTAQSSGLFENLSAGTYEVFIEDDGDECLISEIFILEDPIPIQIDFTVNNSPTMNTITVSASGGEAPYTYSLDGTNYVNGDLPLAGTGTYTIYARDLTGCVATKAVYLTSEGRNVIFLDPDATGDESGSSWSDAITDLQAAIEAAAVTASDDFPSEVWAIDGTYYPDVPSSTDRRKTIFMRNNVHLLGGFASGETEASERDPKVRVTTLSGDIGVPGDSTDNSYGMLTVGTDVTNEALIDGWTLQGAFSLAIEPTNGAIHLMGDVGTFHIRNCEFRFNLSNQGACIRTLGVINTTSTVNIETSAFYNNGFLATSNYIGSAIYVKNELSVANSVFFDNRSGLGGVFYIGGQDGQLSSINNTYYQSLAGNSGSVLFDASGGTATVRWYNNINSGELVEPDEALIVQTSIGSVFEGTNNISGGQTLSGVNNLVVDPQFVSTNIRNLDLRLSHCSPAVNAGDDARLPMGISLDFAGNPRQFNTVDIGAFELQSDPFEITAVETDAVSCFGGSDGSITVTASSPFTPLEYSLNGNAFVSTAVFSNLSAGTYSVTVRDANSCQETLTAVEVASPDELLLSVFTTGLTCFEEGDGGIQITASGGTGMYEYSVDGGTTWLQTPNFAGLDAGNYDVAVRDENGCIATQLEILSQPTKLSATLTEEDLSCFDDASGMISITATGGTAPYQYSIDGTNFQNSSDFMNLSAGSYQV
ncbi:MAG: SprB repeat-containing protein, partial [Bacteroidota bacterium]